MWIKKADTRTYGDVQSEAAIASLLRPRVHPSEAHRAAVRAAMLREFARAGSPTVPNPDAGTRDGDTDSTATVLRVPLGDATVTLADVETISAEDGERAAAALARILERRGMSAWAHD